MQGYTSDELHVVVDHIPLDFVTAGFPAVSPDGIVALDADEIVVNAYVAVERSSLHYQFRVLLETAGGGFHNGESLGKDAVKAFLDGLILLLDELVGLSREFLLFADGNIPGEFLANLGDSLLEGLFNLTKLLLQGGAALPELVVAQGVYLGIDGEYLVQYGLYAFIVTFGLGAEQFSDY